jgi:hypothetical protein
MGQIGELKLSPRSSSGSEPEKIGESPPPYLREASYRSYSARNKPGAWAGPE